MSPPTDRTLFALPRPAQGLAKRWNQGVLVAMHVLPGPLRRRLGWWRWDELLEGPHYGDAIFLHGDARPHRLPAAKLWRRGLLPASPPAGKSLWPRAFRSLFEQHDPSDIIWARTPDEEFLSWVGMWQAHPQGKECLDRALEGLVRKGQGQRVEWLLATPAGQDAPGFSKKLFEALWSAPRPLGRTLALWDLLVKADRPVQAWEDWDRDDSRVAPRQLTAQKMEEWRQSGLPLPTGEAAMAHALAWVKDPPVSTWSQEEEGIQAAIEAVRWFKAHGNLPDDAPTRLLQTWLSTACPGSGPGYRQAIDLWLDELMGEGLPPRPPKGPGWRQQPSGLEIEDTAQPWSHWWAKGPLFENIPLEWVERIFDEPDAWSSVNAQGEDIRDIIPRRVRDARRQQRDTELDKIQAWVLSHAMQEALPAAPARGPIGGSRPRL